MALTFIGISPDPLPLPEGLTHPDRELNGRRIFSVKPKPPQKVRVRYTVTSQGGHIKAEEQDVEGLPPEGCTVRQFVGLLHEFGPMPLQQLSARHPLELRYHGQKLEPDKQLSDYAVKENSLLQIVVKPRLSDYEVREDAQTNPVVTRVRLTSHKLSAPINIDGLTPESTVADLKRLVKEYVQRSPIWLVKGQQPPGTANPAEIILPQADPDGMDVTVKLVEAAKADPELWPLTFKTEDGSEDKLFRIHFNGFPLADDDMLSCNAKLGLTNNEMLYLNFTAPWEPDEPFQPPGKADKKKK